MLLQEASGLLRPARSSSHRSKWLLGHRCAGIGLVILACVTCVLGYLLLVDRFSLAKTEGTLPRMGCAVVSGGIALCLMLTFCGQHVVRHAEPIMLSEHSPRSQAEPTEETRRVSSCPSAWLSTKLTEEPWLSPKAERSGSQGQPRGLAPRDEETPYEKRMISKRI